MFKFIVLLMFFLGSALADMSKFEVKSLPGWDGALPSKWFSGTTYVGAPPMDPTGKMYVHWMLVEAESNPEKAPLLVWYNGGPGASSMFGLLVELGPLLLNAESYVNPKFNSTGIPQLTYNPWTWTKKANVLVLDNPPPVGFSYCEPAGPSGPGTSCGPWNDSTVQETNVKFYKQFFSDFPEYADRDFWITGESYAGVYVPIITDGLLKVPSIAKNIKGMAVGDGCMGTEILCGGAELKVPVRNGPWYEIMFFYGHGQVSNELFDTILDKCPVASLKSGKDISTECQTLVKKMRADLGGYFQYDLYDGCDGQIFGKRLQGKRDVGYPHYEPPYPPFPGPGFPCATDALPTWVNRSDVKQALNVATDAFWFNADNGKDFKYTPSWKTVLPIYKDLLTNTDITVLVYNADADPVLNSFITQAQYFPYLAEEGIKMTDEWRPWTVDGKAHMGGYVQSYGKFSYATVRGAGHMVPEYTPNLAFGMLEAFMNGNKFPQFSP